MRPAIEEGLLAAGATPVIARGTADAAGDFDGMATRWMDSLWTTLAEEYAADTSEAGSPRFQVQLLTEADVRLFTTLARFDAVYHGHFKCNRNPLTAFPALWAYARDLFTTPGFGDTIDFVQIKQHYYLVHTDINPTRIVPKGPDLSGWLTPHGREALGGRPFGDGTPPLPPQPAEQVPSGHSPLAASPL